MKSILKQDGYGLRKNDARNYLIERLNVGTIGMFTERQMICWTGLRDECCSVVKKQ